MDPHKKIAEEAMNASENSNNELLNIESKAISITKKLNIGR